MGQQAAAMPASMPACETQAAVADRIMGALFGMLIGDALAMPTHWFYGGERQVAATYSGRLQGYVAPTTHLQGSIMSKSNTGGGGRGGFNGDVIGSVIFHGMKPGENTLEGVLARRVINITGRSGGFDRQTILEDYINFMTTPHTHNDTYCGTCHRMFFANYAAGLPAEQCPDNDRHNVDTADSIVTTIPVALTDSEDDTASQHVKDMVSLTRDSPSSQQHAALFASTLRSVVRGMPVKEAAVSASQSVGTDITRNLGHDPVTA